MHQSTANASEPHVRLATHQGWCKIQKSRQRTRTGLGVLLTWCGVERVVNRRGILGQRRGAWQGFIIYIRSKIITHGMPQSHQSQLFPPVYGDNFFIDYAGRLITDPKIAIIELVANSWDAQAKNVKIKWPDNQQGDFEIVDDGEGMTRDEFITRWNTFNYNRKSAQITNNQPLLDKTRPIYGKNGKGRHSLFCFSDQYTVETWRDGNKSTFKVSLLKSQRDPYTIELTGEGNKEGHGTRIFTHVNNHYISTDELEKILGLKFVVDPSFDIYVNKKKIERWDLLKNATRYPYHIPGEGSVNIYIIDSQEPGRISGLHGVVYWVNKRLVGEHSWKNFENTYLDGRTQAAKRYSIIVEADLLEDEVLADWTWFKDTPRANKITGAIHLHILETIHNLLSDVRTEEKRSIIQLSRNKLRNLGDFSKVKVGNVIEEIQKSCPAMNQRYLVNVIDIVINLEMTSTGYKLLHQLAETSPDDMDALSGILDEWTMTEAKIVLDLLGGRLKLINEIERRSQNPDIDELHELLPLFEEGLWIFGPEYEGVKYLANKQINTILKTFFKGKSRIQSERRPDIISLPNSVIKSFSCDDYEEGESSGIQKVFILELKTDDITIEERRQAEDYVELIRKSGVCNNKTQFLGYALGASIKCDEIKIDGDRVRVVPQSFAIVLRRAKARTFNLMEKIKESKKVQPVFDTDIQEILSEPYKVF